MLIITRGFALYLEWPLQLPGVCLACLYHWANGPEQSIIRAMLQRAIPRNRHGKSVVVGRCVETECHFVAMGLRARLVIGFVAGVGCHVSVLNCAAAMGVQIRGVMTWGTNASSARRDSTALGTRRAPCKEGLPSQFAGRLLACDLPNAYNTFPAR